MNLMKLTFMPFFLKIKLMNDTSLYINLDNLKNNINFIRLIKSAKNKTILAIIKSDAYGHGLVPSAETLFNAGIDFFGIINISEADAILKKIPQAKLLMLKGVYPEDLKEAAELNLRIGAFSLDYLKILLDKAKSAGIDKPLNIHIKYDSGMNRLGLNEKEIKSAADIIKENKKYFNAEGLFSHLSSGGSDLNYTNFQIANFKKAVSLFNKNGIKFLYVHISASSALLNDKIEEDYSNAVRPGISLYGFNPNTNIDEPKYSAFLDSEKNDTAACALKPLMTLKSRILQIKKVKKGGYVSYDNTFKAPIDMNIAIVSAGYDNGIPRLMSNKGRVLINGKFASIKGMVTMNLIMADVTKIQGIKAGDEVIIAGKSGANEITIQEIARIAQTIPYEICLNFGKSNKRIFTPFSLIKKPAKKRAF
ncbi:MAG: alanine racemase [Deltaproteobacteria bacterium]|nr:alanine racemase [Deltaproteobacteria bacterium]